MRVIQYLPSSSESTHVLNTFVNPIKDVVVKNPDLAAEIKAKDYDQRDTQVSYTRTDGSVVTERSFLNRLGSGEDFMYNITGPVRVQTFKEFALDVLNGRVSGPYWTRTPTEKDLVYWYRTYLCSLDEEEEDFFLMFPLPEEQQ